MFSTLLKPAAVFLYQEITQQAYKSRTCYNDWPITKRLQKRTKLHKWAFI